jgi:hypothetical protein
MYPRSIVKLAAYHIVLRVPHIMKMWTSNVHIYDRVSTNLTQIMYVYIYIQIYSCHPLDH